MGFGTQKIIVMIFSFEKYEGLNILDSILTEVRNHKMGTSEARVRIINLIEDDINLKIKNGEEFI